MRRVLVLGHPPHPITVHLPIGLWTAVMPFDMLAWWMSSPTLWAAAHWAIVAGLLAAAISIPTGLLDFATNVGQGRPANLATVHLLLMTAATVVFAVSLLYRGGIPPPNNTARLLALVLDSLGVVLVSVGGWFGGELVYGHRVEPSVTRSNRRASCYFSTSCNGLGVRQAIDSPGPSRRRPAGWHRD